jgi:hypothetical protein
LLATVASALGVLETDLMVAPIAMGDRGNAIRLASFRDRANLPAVQIGALAFAGHGDGGIDLSFDEVAWSVPPLAAWLHAVGRGASVIASTPRSRRGLQ